MGMAHETTKPGNRPSYMTLELSTDRSSAFAKAPVFVFVDIQIFITSLPPASYIGSYYNSLLTCYT
jgi:hypothetical protein